MNTFEFARKWKILTPNVIRQIGIKAVHANFETVKSDLMVANAEGLTFAGNQISDFAPFSDWEESGEFHKNLKFESESDIMLTSFGDGAKAVFDTFPENDTIAPSAKVLDKSTKEDIRNEIINKIKSLIIN